MTLNVYTTQGLQKAPASTVYDSDQIGTVKAFAGKTIPTNWMIADGRALLRLGYPELYAAIGTAYGVGDGSTTFNLPDLRSKFLYGSASATLADLGTLGGEATHQLLAAEAAQKAGSTGNDANDHTHALPWATTAGGSSAAYAPGGTTGGATQTSGRSTTHTHTIPGSDAAVAHNNLPPYVLIAHIIKVTGVQIDAGGALVGPSAGASSMPMDTWHLVGTAGEPAFQNSWANVAGQYATAAFRKDPLGKVQLRGALKSGASTTTAFTLPVGYRPANTQQFFVSQGSQAASGYTSVIVEVASTGTVSIYTNGASTAYIDLGPVVFDTDSVTAFPTGPQGPVGPAGPAGGNATVPINAWTALPYASAWADLGGGWQGGSYRRDPLGMVQLRGLVRNISATFSFGGANSVIATLPVGYRPVNPLRVDCGATDGSTAANGHVMVDISAAGALTLTGSSDGRITTGALGTYVSLEDIEFDSGIVTQMPTGPQGPQGLSGKQIISRGVDSGTIRNPPVGSYGEVNAALRVSANLTLGNYAKLSIVGQWEHNTANNYIAFQIYDLTAGAYIPGTFVAFRTTVASQNVTYFWEMPIPVAASGGVLPGARTLTVHANTGNATCSLRNDTAPMVFTCQELQQ